MFMLPVNNFFLYFCCVFFYPGFVQLVLKSEVRISKMNI